MSTNKIITPTKYIKYPPSMPNDEKVILFLKQLGSPTSLALISFYTGISKSHICQIVKRLENFKILRKVTTVPCSFYVLEENKKTMKLQKGD